MIFWGVYACMYGYVFVSYAEVRSESKQMGTLEVCFNISCAYA